MEGVGVAGPALPDPQMCGLAFSRRGHELIVASDGRETLARLATARHQGPFALGALGRSVGRSARDGIEESANLHEMTDG